MFGRKTSTTLDLVSQLLVSIDSTMVLAGSTHASLSSVPPSLVTKTCTVMVTTAVALPSAPMSPVHRTKLTGFSNTWQVKFDGVAVAPRTMRPVGSASSTTTSVTAAPLLVTVIV
ncbi:MAG: hypothetical protein BWY91_03298 [bacterium ADurb.BinA028]|nr:MAG: hypothetical protein BWY91_03298 [bacterium ADurb.BinA028]